MMSEKSIGPIFRVALSELQMATFATVVCWDHHYLTSKDQHGIYVEKLHSCFVASETTILGFKTKPNFFMYIQPSSTFYVIGNFRNKK